MRVAAPALRVAACVLVATSAAAQAPPPEYPSGWIDEMPVASRHFMVATANPLATQAGYETLRAGGNASTPTATPYL